MNNKSFGEVSQVRFSDIKQTGEPRKMRREREGHQAILMRFVNAYIEFKELNKHDAKNKLLIQNELKIQESNWKSFVRNWNKNPKHLTELRLDEFQNLLIYKENLEGVGNEEG